MTDRSKNTKARRQQWADRALAGDPLALDPLFRAVLGELDQHIHTGGPIGEKGAEAVARSIVRTVRGRVPGAEAMPTDHPNNDQRFALKRRAEDEKDNPTD
jgi:hypothetical protein